MGGMVRCYILQDEEGRPLAKGKRNELGVENEVFSRCIRLKNKRIRLSVHFYMILPGTLIRQLETRALKKLRVSKRRALLADFVDVENR
jgi:hypothetical protein